MSVDIETIQAITVGNFVISNDASIKDALQLISINKHGIVFLSDSNQSIIACVTDGDIRNYLIEVDGTDFLNQPISICANTNFVYLLKKQASHEQLLKTLDSHIKVVPILTDDFKLVDIVTSQTLRQLKQRGQVIRSKSPVRISFSGGGTDISSYFMKNTGAVLNATINLFSYATLIVRDDSKVILHSLDLNIREEFDSFTDVMSTDNLQIIKSVLKIINPQFGFELITRSDVPVGSGLGGSAVLISAVIGVFNNYNGNVLDSYEIAQLAYQSERLGSEIAGGWQDQYATVFGGFNYIDLNNSENVVHPLRVSDNIINELEESLLLCYTGIKHDSNEIHEDQKKVMSDESVEAYAKEMMTITVKMKQKLLKNKLNDFGELLHQSWELKKTFSNKISSDYINSMYDVARKNGALGGKVLGAGGGGYFLFYVPLLKRQNVTNELKKHGLTVEKFQFVMEGLKTWRPNYE